MASKRPSGHADSIPAKRAKFDGRHATKLAPEETFDPLEADIAVGTARKKDVKLDGYASDSSEEGHGVKRAPTLENEAGPVDEDDDMFGEAPSKQADHVVRDKDKGGKGERFLELNEIQGQDFSTKTDYMDIVDDDEGDEDEEDDDDSVDEEVGALGKKRNAPKLDGFNMRAEMEEGKFDAEGNYIRTAKDQKDNQDDWLKDVSRKDIAAAREAVERRQQEESQRMQAEDERSVAELLAELIGYLDRGETLLEALSRLGATTGPKRKGHGKRGAGVDPTVAKQVERMTELANRLMADSQIDVYDTEKEGLARAYKRETGIDLPLPADDSKITLHDDTPTMWEFVWAGAEESINGPYDKDTMKSWLEDGLLTTDTATALVRRIGEITFIEASQALFNS
ncbi:Putative uncharacterized protein [Taphrina deformans PYCC 5710]|uniref:GYF domain-containing protein n=1 Tax=Taphrina deformans (strain PYCC 5710 / ATCC 11124 / CBS 356.35 / IMI 108563 / JCM 9778 / NBRC 8474) TaxID=1097556 RepID=R4X6P7_TAPDE|nr:Putative uncharacterized protein [Taphrina deformans PYCC 5710]|eukprot:CCG80571.1 Putative uncharacterized protein [Taphrina deformans PYCC 5710]